MPSMGRLALYQSAFFVIVALKTAAEETFISALEACPQLCSEVGNKPADWTVYDSVERLNSCTQPLLLDFAIFNPLDSPDTTVRIGACTVDNSQNAKRQEIVVNTCQENGQTEAAVSLASSGTRDFGKSRDVITAAKQVQNFLKTTENCGTVTNFGYSNKTVVGLYVGGNVQNKAAADAFVQKFIDQIQSNGIAETTLAQYCGPDSDYVLGIVANTKGDLASAQRAVRSWSDSECVAGLERETKEWAKLKLKVANSAILAANKGVSPAKNYRAKSNWQKYKIGPRATCSYIKVVSGDSCATLASKCKITGAKFMSYNTKANLCSTLAVGQPVCCSSGTLPDLRPKPLADGTCASVVVKSGNYCAAIAASNGLTVANLETFNKQTWGWTGCNNLLAGIRMCLSTGNPPMPAAVSNAVCGPQVPGSKPPAAGKTLASLNPCKLNACCNIWGQCGTTSDFCTISKSPTGAPGTSAPGVNGCISNCGTDVIKAAKPATFFSIAYYEAWAPKRPCLQMPVDLIDKSKYTHIHYAFAEITTDFKVDISGVQGEWDRFKKMTGIKKIISFGGWSFSTEQDSYPIFREAVTDAHRQTFATNAVNFLKQHNLDGLDFDWEYPGAPDIPGIPPGGKNDGANYLKFLKMVRAILPAGKTLSIAVPASFWYLQGFHPLKDFAPVLDYVIYMTYDLHGQWDYGNKWSSPGCPAGNCLRSHVNTTETLNALSMITKAGIPSNKVIVGVSSYGRSFKMTKAGCTGPMCTFTGPASGAMPGRCTGTRGYISNAEINEILRLNPSAKKLYDTESTSDIVVFNNTEWVAYMDDKNKAGRTGWYRSSLNMGGITDWAVDLQAFVSRPPVPTTTPKPTTTTTKSTTTTTKPPATPTLAPCDKNYNTLDEINNDKNNIPDHCMNIYLLKAQANSLEKAISDYENLLADDYQKKWWLYFRYVNNTLVPEFIPWVLRNSNTYFNCYRPFSSGDEQVSCPNARPTWHDNFVEPSIKWVLKDETVWKRDVSDQTGIDPSWFDLKDIPSDKPPHGPCGEACTMYWYGFPVLDESRLAPSPARLIRESIDNLKVLVQVFRDVARDGNATEIKDALAASEVPVFMTQTAIESMRKVIEMADDIIEQDKKAAILTWVSGFLWLLPTAGSYAKLFGFAMTGRVLSSLGNVAISAFSLYSVIDDPSSAMFVLMGLMVGAEARAVRGNVGKMAIIRRAMTGAENAFLGQWLVDRTVLLRNLMKVL
ncbi:hypothetical protein TWF788_003433 [Orbilia oligospora]|uniref:chitinase n=1 Tax=Orbilia oligospora TaxID=2813651 RepID=A0A7C8K887_ORBOL|nr:hypothetical protein TWF788_003433 [Orbilia oligospora]